MPSKFDPQKHHRRSIRLPNYDYSQPGAYYVTIVAWHRECLFGEVVEGEMKLTKFGLVARQQWEKLPKRFPNIELGAFVIIPNHLHGIILIMNGRGTAGNRNGHDGESSRRAPTREQFQKPVKGSVPTIVRSYKSAVSYRINLCAQQKVFPFGSAIITNISFVMNGIYKTKRITSRRIPCCGMTMMKIQQISNRRGDPAGFNLRPVDPCVIASLGQPFGMMGRPYTSTLLL
jgi:putative transposase